MGRRYNSLACGCMISDCDGGGFIPCPASEMINMETDPAKIALHNQCMVEVNGQKIGDGETVTVDNTIQTFTISIRSLSGADADVIKRLIQQRYEVVTIEKTHSAHFRTGLCALCCLLLCSSLWINYESYKRNQQANSLERQRHQGKRLAKMVNRCRKTLHEPLPSTQPTHGEKVMLVNYEYFPGNRVFVKEAGEYGEVTTCVPGNGTLPWYFVKLEQSGIEDRYTADQLSPA